MTRVARGLIVCISINRHAKADNGRDEGNEPPLAVLFFCMSNLFV